MKKIVLFLLAVLAVVNLAAQEAEDPIIGCFSIEVYFSQNHDGTQGVENVEEPKAQSHKMLREGQLIIRRGEKTYTVTGQEVK